MQERSFFNLLEARFAEGKRVCVGLDVDMKKLPKTLGSVSNPVDRIATFCCEIIKSTHDLVCAYKPNAAFYEALYQYGPRVLDEVVTYLHRVAPDVPLIYDAKRADIDNTNNGYVAALERIEADAVTVHPYLGHEALKPFLDLKKKGIFVLCRTSNRGAGEMQGRRVLFDSIEEMKRFERHIGEEVPEGSISLYEYLAWKVVTEWDEHGNCGLVVGATYPEEMARVRKIAKDTTFLIPGIGAQGGDLEKTIAAAKLPDGRGMIINSSRGIIYASSGEDFAEAARRETQKLSKQINSHLLMDLFRREDDGNRGSRR